MIDRPSTGFLWRPKPYRWFGFERAPIKDYMDRWIAYFGWFNLRVHKFLRGDDDRAPHDHPFWFITIPTKSYFELVMEKDGLMWIRKVRAWLPHFRRAKFRHIVLGTERVSLGNYKVPKPFYTFVIAGARTNGWGFWPSKDKFIPWRDWQ